MVYELNCKTQGVGKATIPFVYIFEIIKDEKSTIVNIEIKEDCMYIGNLKIQLNTCLIKDDSILRTIRLPANYTEIDLAKLAHQGYTVEELDFNRLIPQIIQAQKNINTKITKAYNILCDLGFSRNDIVKIVSEKAHIEVDKFIKPNYHKEGYNK